MFPLETSFCLIQAALILLLPSSIYATPRTFLAKSRYTGEVNVRLDVEFTIDLSVRKSGQEIESTQLTERDVHSFHLYERDRDLVYLELVFKGTHDDDAGFLNYRFSRVGPVMPVPPVYYRKFIDLIPRRMFYGLTDTVDRVELDDPVVLPENIGYPYMSFRSDKNETVHFQTRPESSHIYDYVVTMSTTYFHVQAFGVHNGEFGPTLFATKASEEVPQTSSGSTQMVLVAEVVGGVLFIALVVAAVMLIHRRPWKKNARRGYEVA